MLKKDTDAVATNSNRSPNYRQH